MFFENSQKNINYDLIVIGNNLSAVIVAGMAAKNNKSVALVTQSELLFSEISEGLLGYVQKNSPIYDLLLELGAEPVKVGDEYQIPSGMAAKIALEYLINNNVNVFLKAATIGMLVAKSKTAKHSFVSGVAIATKFGAYTLKGAFVADFSDRRYFFEPPIILYTYTYAFQMGGVELGDFALPTTIEADVENISEITLHGDCRSADTCIITFKTTSRNPSSASELSVIANRLAQYLIKFNPAFKNSGILKYSLRPVLCGTDNFTPKKNLLKFKAGCILNSENFYNAIVFANDLISNFTENAKFIEPEFLVLFDEDEYPLSSLYTGEELDEFLGAELLKIRCPFTNHSMLHVETELFIAGLGAGGAAAMKAAVDSGVKVVAAEALPLPGGTRGQGMVSAFWHGYQGGFATENLKNVKTFGKENLGKNVPTYTAEIAYDIDLCKDATVFYESIVFDVVKGKDICEVFLATPLGVVSVVANKFIDATGDADLAMLSGVEYMPNGDPRDRVTQGYSVWGEEKIGTPFVDSLYKSDEDSISTECYSEFLRGIFKAHLKQSDYGFSALLTVRESRRIKGKYTLNMKDILSGRLFDDTLTVSLCKYDAHGVGSSPAYYTCFLNSMRGKEYPDVLTRIPLRALLPKNDSRLMVISKAISATRDAGCLIRMNPDIQNTGYAAGLIAANAAKNNIDFEAAYTDEIKNELIKKQILPDCYNKSSEHKNDEILTMVKNGDKAAMAYASVSLELLPIFENEDDVNCRLVALALGSSKPFETALSEFNTFVNEYMNSSLSAEEIKSYAILLSRVAADDENKKELFVPALAKAIRVMDSGGGYGDPMRGIYQNSKVSNRVVPNFRVIMGLCIAAETVADKILAHPLMELRRKKNIRLSDGDEIHSVQLYLRIIAAAARCGNGEAKAELEKYICSERLFFREFVKSELDALSFSGDDVLPVELSEFWL